MRFWVKVSHDASVQMVAVITVTGDEMEPGGLGDLLTWWICVDCGQGS